MRGTQDAAPHAGQAGMGAVGPAAATSGAAAEAAPMNGAGGVMNAIDPMPIAGSNPTPVVDFAWTETIPGMGSCLGATFTGNFSCLIAFPLGVLSDQLEGSLTIVLKGSTEAQLLTVAAGQVIAFDDSMRTVVAAPVTGSLDCNTQVFDADLQPTISAVIPLEKTPIWLNVVPQPQVTGLLKGYLDPRTQTIRGDLTLAFDPSPTCIGTFSVRAAP